MMPIRVTIQVNRFPKGAMARAVVKKAMVGMVGEARIPFLYRCLWAFRSLRCFVWSVSAFTKRKSFLTGCPF